MGVEKDQREFWDIVLRRLDMEEQQAGRGRLRAQEVLVVGDDLIALVPVFFLSCPELMQRSDYVVPKQVGMRAVLLRRGLTLGREFNNPSELDVIQSLSELPEWMKQCTP